MPRSGLSVYSREVKRGGRRGKPGVSWYLDFTFEGERFVRHLGTNIDKETAERKAIKLRSAILQDLEGVGKKKKHDLSFEKACEIFLDWAETNKRPGTAKFYRHCISKLKKEFSGKKLSKIHPFNLEAYKKRRTDSGVNVAINRELGTLRTLYNRLGMGKGGLKKYDGQNPVTQIEFLEEPKTKLRFLEDDEEEQLMTEAGETLGVAIQLALHTGIRIQSEGVSTLRVGAVDLKRGLLHVASGYAKSGRERNIPLNSEIRGILAKHIEGLEKSGTDDFLFVNRYGKPYSPNKGIWKAFTAACKRAKLHDVTPHTLRHTFASRLMMRGVDTKTIMELAGWSEIRMLERYTHLNPRHKADAVERLARKDEKTRSIPRVIPQLKKSRSS